MKGKSTFVIILILLICLYGCLKTSSQNTDISTSPVTPTYESQSELSDTTLPLVTATEETPIIINEVDDKEGTFFLGQSYIDTSSILYDRDIDILQGSDTMLYTDRIEFSFYESKIDQILVAESSKMPTTLGLNFGDSYDQMVQLYGTEYSTRNNSSNVIGYEYIIGDHTFYVEFYDGQVSKWGISKTTPIDVNSENEDIDIDNVRPVNYYDYLLVETYISSRIRAINNNNFDSIAEYLDENSDIYQSEKIYVEDCVLKGIQHTLVDSYLEDLRQVSENLYDIYWSIGFEEIGSDNTKAEKTIYQKFTVFDNGDDLKITNITPLANDYVKIGEQAAKDCFAYLFGDSDVDHIINTLGEPEKKKDTTYYHRWYFKQGVEIDVVFESSYNTSTENGESFTTEPVMRNYVYISDCCNLKINRDIGIGSTYEEVMHAYQDEIYPELTNRDLISVGIGDINFVMKNDKVSSIYILSCSEMMSPEYYGEFKPDPRNIINPTQKQGVGFAAY